MPSLPVFRQTRHPTTIPTVEVNLRGTDLHFEIQLLRLLSTFFGENPHPSAADWARLVGSYPAHEAAVIDFAVRYAASGRVSAEGLPKNWGLG